ncbi:MAG: TonB-dependent receptor [Porticoccaceae bacterium]
MKKAYHYGFLAVFAGGATLPVGAIAQGSSALEEIIVTATRRDGSLQSVPISVTAVQAGDLENARIQGITNLSLVTPGLNMTKRADTFTATIRGIGSLDTSAGQEAAVAIYYDDVYISNPQGIPPAFNNIERVEVLKGPQGTLFGRNATGGLIHVITHDPSETPTVSGKIGYGNYNTSELQLYGATGFIDTIAGDIALFYKNQGEGYGDNVTLNKDVTASKSQSARSKWLFTPGDDTRITFIADYWTREDGDNRALIKGSVGTGGYTALPEFHDVQGDFDAKAEVDSWGVSAKIEHDFAQFDFISVTSYRELEYKSVFDNDGLPIPLVHARAAQDIETLVHEMRIQSPSDSGRIHWTTGVFYMKDENGYAGPRGLNIFGMAFPDPVTGNPAGVAMVNKIDTASWALFGDTTIDLTEQLHLSLGSRWIHDQKKISGRTDVLTEDNQVFVSLPTPEGEKSWSEWTWRAVLAYDITNDFMVYGSYNRGFRSGTYNLIESTGIAVDPEKVDSYEVGFKSQFFDNKVRLNASVFYNDYKNLQTAINLGVGNATVNAGEAEILGAELEGRVLAHENIELVFGVAYLDTEYKEFPSTTCNSRAPDGTTVSEICSPEGNDLVKAPKYTFNIGSNFTFARNDNGEFGGSINYFWTDDFSWEPENRLIEESYGLLNSQLYWSSPTERYRINLYGENITNKKYSVFMAGQPGIGDQYVAASPRTFGIEFQFKL